MYYWMKLNHKCNTEEEALARARVYALEPYVKDYYVAKARKYYYPVIEVDLHALKHPADDSLGNDDPFT